MSQESGPETIQRVLSSYELGRKLRQLRLRKKIALVDLGKHTGLSPSMLSQLKNGKMIPTLPTLARIAMVSMSASIISSATSTGARAEAVFRSSGPGADALSRAARRACTVLLL